MHYYCDNKINTYDTSIKNEKSNQTIEIPSVPSPPPSSNSSSPTELTNKKMNELLLIKATKAAAMFNDDYNSNLDINDDCSNHSNNSISKQSFLSRHPETWTREEVNSWLKWCSSEYGLSDIPFHKFEMNGKALCILKEEMFKERVPNSGDILYQTLQNLIPKVSTYSKNYLETYNGNNKNLITSSSGQVYYQQQADTTMLDTTTTTTINLVVNNSDNEIDNSNKINNKLIIDENSNNSENNFKVKSKSQGNKATGKTKPTTTATPTVTTATFERKRTANLENVIGNLISRQKNLNSSNNYTGNNGSNLNYEIDRNSANNDYVLISQPLSPSASSTASSISNSSNSPSSSPKPHSKSQQTKPKHRWIEENETDKKIIAATVTMPTPHDIINSINVKHFNNNNNNNTDNADSANGTASSPSSTRCDQDLDTLKEHMSTPVSSCASDNGHPASPVNAPNAFNEFTNIILTNQFKNTKATGNKGSKSQAEKNSEKIAANADDPTRQIKFYDDYIDFRGDILKRPPGAKNCRILWEYLYILLQDKAYSSIIRWEDSVQMVFRIVQAEKLAALWGLQKNRLGMTYEKLSRGMRYYYPNNIIAREPGRRLLYRFMRHPDDIKKSVKKNGTYMLKRAKAELKNNKNSNSVNSTKNKNNSQFEEEDEVDCEDENEVEEGDEEEDNKNKNNNNNNNNDDDSGLDETSTISPVPEKKQKVNNNNDSNDNLNKSNKNNSSNNHSEKHKSKLISSITKNNPLNNNTTSTSNNNNSSTNQSTSTPNAAAAAAVTQRFYPTLYHPFLNFFQRPTNNDDVLAAHFLMQLRNQNNNDLQLSAAAFNSNLDNVTSKLAAVAAAAATSQNSLNLQQILSNEAFLTTTNQRSTPIKSPNIKQDANNSDNENKINDSINIKIEIDDEDDDNHKVNNENVNSKLPQQNNNSKSNKTQFELPLNLCVNNKKRKLNTLNIKKEKATTSDDENQENNDIDNQNENNNETNDDSNTNKME